MTKFEESRLKFFIKQANAGTFVSLGQGDAVLFQKLLEANAESAHNFKAAAEWKELALKIQEAEMELELQVIELKEKLDKSDKV